MDKAREQDVQEIAILIFAFKDQGGIEALRTVLPTCIADDELDFGSLYAHLNSLTKQGFADLRELLNSIGVTRGAIGTTTRRKNKLPSHTDIMRLEHFKEIIPLFQAALRLWNAQPPTRLDRVEARFNLLSIGAWMAQHGIEKDVSLNEQQRKIIEQMRGYITRISNMQP